MLPRDLTREVKTRIKSLKGQLDGLATMLEQDVDPEEILNQFKATQKGLENTYTLLLDEVYRKALAIKISETADACPGNCGNEIKIEELRRQFPELDLNDLTNKLKEITAIKNELDQHNTGQDSHS